MAIIKPIKGFRPTEALAKKVASRPYDVLNSEEARTEAEGNPYSFLRIVKSEIDLAKDVDLYDEQVYATAKNNFNEFVEKGILVQDEKPCLYFYRLIMGDVKQTGIVCGSSSKDYFEDVIKKHEYTRPKKEKDRIKHIQTSEIHAGPVFLAYKHNKRIDEIVGEYTMHQPPTQDFEAEDGIQHTLWKVDNEGLITDIVNIFEAEIAATYIADGHHRAASTSKVGKMLAEKNEAHTGTEDYNYFLSVLFPDNQVKIIDYNRVVKDLNGHSKEAFLEAISEKFDVENNGNQAYKPSEVGTFGLYLDSEWYVLKIKEKYKNTTDSVDSLDISILQKYLFDPILSIIDQRTDERIDFVGGIRGMKELERRVDSGDMQLAISIFPVSIQQLFDVADSGKVMPPKSTWFEPKLRSGLVVYKYV